MGPLRLVHSGWSHSLERARQGKRYGAGRWRYVATAGCHSASASGSGSAQMDRTKSILVGLVSTSSCLDWTWLASNQVQMDLV
jgi:hypothetical protein